MAVISVLLIAFGSPIFRTLGFEYSAISALLLSIAVGYLAAARASIGQTNLFDNLIAGLTLWLVPLILSTISLLFVSNCAYWDGVVFYLQIALPTSVLAAAYGTALGRLSSSKRLAVVYFSIFWVLTFLVSLLPGYIFPQLFTYGWQYGFFPGLVWDEYVELGSGYAWHLIEWGMLATILLLIAERGGRSTNWWLKLTAIALVYLGLLLHRSDNRITSSHSAVGSELSSTLIAGKARVHFRGPSLTPEERQLLMQDISWYLHDTRTRLELNDTSIVDIYLYPDVESLYRFVGTRNASIAKPWISEVHIAKENLHSLRHELVHVLLREWGSFPFNASWSTGMTEGVAMAIEPTYDGMHTLHEHASGILQMKLAEGVQRVMSFTGFASGASTTSYVLAGSFSQFLLENYPVSKFKASYASLDFEENYGKPLEALEKEWKSQIMPLAADMDRYDSLRTEFYFQRSSIIAQPCLRRLGKHSNMAQKAAKAHRHNEAESLYSEIYDESRSLSSLRGMITAKLRSGDMEGAKKLLASTDISTHPQRLSLYLSKGDLIADDYYDTLIVAQLSSGSVLAANSRKHIYPKQQFLKQLYTSNSPLGAIPIDLMDTSSTLHRPQAYVNDYLIGEAYRDEGMLKHAKQYYNKALRASVNDSNAAMIRQLMMLELMRIDPAYTPDMTPAEHGLVKEFEDLKRRSDYLRTRSANANPSVK
jgi:tetratricopeptide (TPR) repeat protein